VCLFFLFCFVLVFFFADVFLSSFFHYLVVLFIFIIVIIIIIIIIIINLIFQVTLKFNEREIMYDCHLHRRLYNILYFL